MKLKTITSLFLFLVVFGSAYAQKGFDPAEVDPEYTQVLINRVDKFLKDLDLTDSVQYLRLRDIVVRQYQGINFIEEQRDAQVAALREQTDLEKTLRNAQIDLLKSEAREDIFKLHTHFIAQLQTELESEQIDGIKDGMTYGVLQRTYGGYLNLLPKLSEEEKRYILSNLIEARELAMDKGSSDAKHHTFGKYKGRINNYLSARGYDLKEAERELSERQKESDNGNE